MKLGQSIAWNVQRDADRLSADDQRSHKIGLIGRTNQKTSDV